MKDDERWNEYHQSIFLHMCLIWYWGICHDLEALEAFCSRLLREVHGSFATPSPKLFNGLTYFNSLTLGKTGPWHDLVCGNQNRACWIHIRIGMSVLPGVCLHVQRNEQYRTKVKAWEIILAFHVLIVQPKVKPLMYKWLRVQMYSPIHTKTNVIQTDPYVRITAGRSTEDVAPNGCPCRTFDPLIKALKESACHLWSS